MKSEPASTRDPIGTPGGLILGFDPGLSITGYGIIRVRNQQPELVEAGILKMRRDRTLAQRLKELHDGVKEIIDSFPIAVVAIEQLYSHYQRPRTAILMGHARGVLCLAAANADLAVHSYEATKVKRMLTGNGRAPKDQMQQAIRLQLKLKEPPDPPDVADALAIALCHYFTAKQHPQLTEEKLRKKP
ncbi:MAG: crossover junction endodeoxyribonuclease RuvC [Planctomycetota bacterium]